MPCFAWVPKKPAVFQLSSKGFENQVGQTNVNLDISETSHDLEKMANQIIFLLTKRNLLFWLIPLMKELLLNHYMVLKEKQGNFFENIYSRLPLRLNQNLAHQPCTYTFSKLSPRFSNDLTKIGLFNI